MPIGSLRLATGRYYPATPRCETGEGANAVSV